MSRAETAREMVAGAGAMASGFSKQMLGGPLALGAAGFKGDQVAKLYAIGEDFMSNWSGTWGKITPEGTHPIRDPFFADWHSYFVTVQHGGLPGGVAALAMMGGMGILTTGVGQSLIGYLRFKSPFS